MGHFSSWKQLGELDADEEGYHAPGARDVRLSLEAGLSTRVVGERIGVGPRTVRDTLKRFVRAGLAWPVPGTISDTELEQLLYGAPGVKPGRRKVIESDWSVIARELKRKHVTLQVLWEEYIAEHPDGYRYSRFCDLFRNWEGQLPLVMRQHHGGGEKLFVDYAGDTMPVVDRKTGEVRNAHIFVRSWARPACRSCWRRGPGSSATGSRDTTRPSAFLAARRNSWCPTTPRWR